MKGTGVRVACAVQETDQSASGNVEFMSYFFKKIVFRDLVVEILDLFVLCFEFLSCSLSDCLLLYYFLFLSIM